ncbi:MAG TPA: hypothetical protein PLA50_15280, partial [Bacteroidia bacterium]|nr:hypothetical protein [Bacteroidia bacterium]
RLPDKTVARCPACAEEGRDNKGNHLVIYPNGKYGCVSHQGDAEHQRRIRQLVGPGKPGQSSAPIRPVVHRHPDWLKWKLETEGSKTID